MRAKAVFEDLEFKRGIDPKKSMGIGLEEAAPDLIDQFLELIQPFVESGVFRVRGTKNIQQWKEGNKRYTDPKHGFNYGNKIGEIGLGYYQIPRNLMKGGEPKSVVVTLYQKGDTFRCTKIGEHGVLGSSDMDDFFKNFLASLSRDQRQYYREYSMRVNIIKAAYES